MAAARKDTATDRALATDEDAEKVYISKENLLAAIGRKTIDMKIEALGDAPVRVRTLTSDQWQSVFKLQQDDRFSEAEARMLSLSIIEPKLTEKEIQASDPDGLLAKLVFGELSELSAMTPEALAEAEARFHKGS